MLLKTPMEQGLLERDCRNHVHGRENENPRVTESIDMEMGLIMTSGDDGLGGHCLGKFSRMR